MNVSALLLMAGVGTLVIWIAEEDERWRCYNAARTAAMIGRKPILNIGCPRKWSPPVPRYPCPDVCLDISTERLSRCQSAAPTFGDIRAIPFPDRHFSAAICTHVLEHMQTPRDAQKALNELNRVADNVYVAVPPKSDVFAWLHADHHLWVNRSPEGAFAFEQR